MGLAIPLPGISGRIFCLPYTTRVMWSKSSRIKTESILHKTRSDLAWELIELTRSLCRWRVRVSRIPRSSVEPFR